MRIVKIFGLLVLGIFLTGCGLFSPSEPTPTPAVGFVTVTPIPPGAIVSPSAPTPIDMPQPVASSPTATPTQPLATVVTTPPSTVPAPPPSPVVITPTPTSKPYAIIDSPGGFLNVREGPGVDYGAPLGSYNNGASVDLLGKQYARDGRLWWLIPFPTSPTKQGWIFADYTIAYNVDKVPWVNPDLPPPTYIPPYPPVPYAIVDSPNGFVDVRGGPGNIYEPILGSYRNGTVVDILGKQTSKEGELWWLIFFPSVPREEGWIKANETISNYTEGVPWVSAPPTPTPTATVTPTPTPTPTGEPIVEWTISGRVIDSVTVQSIAGASVRADLGENGPSLITVTDGSGAFSLKASAADRGDLVLVITAQDYTERVITTAPRSPRTYNFPNIELTPTKPPAITWAVSGRVTELGTTSPIPGAQIEAILGDDAVRLGTLTNANGEFSVSGEASDSGKLTLNIAAAGYQPNTFVSDQSGSRIYTLPDLQLVPRAGSCAYESVINLSEVAALARLQSLSFTNVSTTSIVVGSDPASLGRVLTQLPEPPPEGRSIRTGCQIPITLGIGVETGP